MAREPSLGTDRQLDFHPGMGMRWEITRSTEDTSGELFESTNWLDPRMAAPPRHLHPNEESFEVIEGSLEVWKNGKWTTVRPGETATAPAGTPHTFRNASNEPATIITRFRPAVRSEAFFRHMHKLIQEGKIKRLPPKDPRSAIYASMLISEYSDEWRATGPMGVVMKATALVGKALRFEL
jgi:mannose-6-phosphate isomerase-like protein (cupin superfamily)